MRVRISDLDTALKGAHADVSGAWEHALGQGVAAPISCEEAARSPRPPLFLPAGGLWVPSKSAKPAPADSERSFWVWLYFLFREYHIYIARRLWRSAPGIRNAAVSSGITDQSRSAQESADAMPRRCTRDKSTENTATHHTLRLLPLRDSSQRPVRS